MYRFKVLHVSLGHLDYLQLVVGLRYFESFQYIFLSKLSDLAHCIAITLLRHIVVNLTWTYIN